MTTSPASGNRGRPTYPTPLISIGTSLSTPVVTFWNQGKAKIDRLLGGAASETTAHESTYRVPYEIVETIIAHLTRDLHALKACSLTCRSWHAVAVPHVYHTLILGRGATHSQLKLLSKLHNQGLMPFVNEIRVEHLQGRGGWFVHKAFNHCDLCYFSAFANVHTLDIRNLEIHRFIPGVERYFGHFSQALRSIKLYYPFCTPQQQSHFHSLFSNLDDVEIWGTNACTPVPVQDTLVPFSAPGPRGWLVLRNHHWPETWTHLISSGGLRFRHMDLGQCTNCIPILLEACAKTLETLQLYATDGYYPIDKLNLSRLRVLRYLRIKAWPTRYSLSGDDRRRSTVMRAFSTITSPVFSDLVIVLAGDAIICLPEDVALFETLDKMNRVRPFNLVFLLNVPNSSQGEARRKFTGSLDFVTAKGLLDFLGSPPTIRCAQSCRYAWDTAP